MTHISDSVPWVTISMLNVKVQVQFFSNCTVKLSCVERLSEETHILSTKNTEAQHRFAKATSEATTRFPEQWVLFNVCMHKKKASLYTKAQSHS